MVNRFQEWDSSSARREIAKVLAAGIIRLKLKQMSNADGDSSDILQHSSLSRLDVPQKTLLSVSNRVNRSSSPRTRSKSC